MNTNPPLVAPNLPLENTLDLMVIRSKGHQIDWENVKVSEREPKEFYKRILEAIHIRTLIPKLNRDKGLDLDPIWDNILMPKRGGATS